MTRPVIAVSLVVFASFLGKADEPLTNAPSPPLRSRLPVVRLDARDPIVSDPKVPCLVRVIPANGNSNGIASVPGLVRIHGGVSQGYPKKSYGLTLERPVTWLGLRESQHWVLNAAFIDRSLMRHKLSYDLFRSLSEPSAPRYAVASRFVEIELNHEYNGAYLLMERVDRALLELARFDSNAPSHSCIYKAVDHSANFASSGHAGYEQHQPDPLVKQYWRPLDEFDTFVSRASDAQFQDAEKGIASRLDVENAIDFHLLVLLTSNMDGITKNFILARDAQKPGAPRPRFFFAPWDYDATFGRNWEASRVEPTAWLSNHLFDRLHAQPEFRRKFAERWKHLRTRQFSVTSINRLIDENVRALGDAAERNEARWHTLDGPYPDRLGFAEDVAQMKAWVVARAAWLDTEIARRAQ